MAQPTATALSAEVMPEADPSIEPQDRTEHREEVAKILSARGFHAAAREVRDASKTIAKLKAQRDSCGDSADQCQEDMFAWRDRALATEARIKDLEAAHEYNLTDYVALSESAKSLQAENARLRHNAKTDTFGLGLWEDRATRAEASVRALKEALEPIAKAARFTNLMDLGDNYVVYMPIINPDYCITVGDLRRATEALATTAEGEPLP